MNKHLNTILLILSALVGVSLPAAASYIPFNTSVNMNVGIGTSTPQGAFVVVNGNVGIGTWAPSALFDVNGNSILGTATSTTDTITSNGSGSLAGGQAEHTGGGAVSGTITSSGTSSFAFGLADGVTGFGGNASIIANSNGAIAMGYAGGGGTLESSGSGSIAMGFAALGTIQASGTGSIAMGYASVGTLQATGFGSVALGENVQATAADAFALGASVINPNTASFMVGFSPTPTLTVTGTGVGIGTSSPFGGGLIVLPANTGNVGIGSLTPGQALDVQGIVRTTGFTMSGNTPISGYVLTASDNSGDVTWSPSSGAGTNYWLNDTGNVGINTTYNVGIGTIAQVNKLNILGNIGIGTFSYDPYMLNQAPSGGMIISGNVGIGTWAPGALFDVNGSSILGTAVSTTDTITSNGTGSMAGGIAEHAGGGLGTVTSSGNGALAFGFALGTVGGNGSIISNSLGAIAMGAGAAGGTLESSNNGSIALGYATVGTLQASGIGSIALGLANSGTLQASGTPSVAIGQNVQATANNAFALGASVVNPNVDSFMVGFNPTPTLTVTGTGVGIGTSSPFGGGLIVLPANTGNVGIGSLTPGQALDVAGTVRMTGLTLTGNGASNGYVMVGNGVGVGTWMPASTLPGTGSSNYWLNDTGNVGINTTYNIGIGTIAQVNTLNILGNIGVGTISYSNYLKTAVPSGGAIFEGNVGIGTWVPSQELIVVGGAIQEDQNKTAADTVLIGDPPLMGYPGIWLGANASSPAYTNYSFLSDGSGGNLFNAASGQLTRFRINNVATLTAGGAGVRIFGADTGSPVDAPLYPFQVQTGSTNFIVNSSGNVGIGSLAPGQALDVQGTVRTTGFTMSGQTPISGYVLTASDSSGDATWSPAGAVGGWTVSGNNVYETSNGNVGIGTSNPFGGNLIVNGGGNVGIGSLTPGQLLDVKGTVRDIGEIVKGNIGIGTSALQTAFAVTNGNVGIGTWTAAGGALIVSNGVGNVGIGTLTPGQALDVKGTVRDIGEIVNGNVGIGTSALQTAFAVTNGNVGIGTWTAAGGALIVSNGVGNVGIGTLTPGQILDVTGTVRAIGFTMSGQTPISGYVLTASDSSGDTTWSSPGTVGGWTTSGNNVYETSNGNVGIGTSNPFGGNLIVNGGGNVGIGSLTPGQILDVTGTARMTGFTLTGNGAAAGNIIVSTTVGVGTWMAMSTLPLATVTNETVNDVAYYSNTNTFSGNPGFQTNGVNVGIGTSNLANATLQVVGNIGIGTVANGDSFINTLPPKGGMIIEGNVGIGTWAAAGGNLIVKGGGNVGIGSVWPGVQLDVNGSIRSLSGGYNFPDGSNQSTAYRGIPQNIQVFTASGTWTRPTLVSTVYVRCWGAGGAGANGAATPESGAGGGGGGYSEGLIGVTGASVTVTIGTGAAAANGGNTTFAGTTTLTANGGTKATGDTPGTGGTASNGVVNITGGAGTEGSTANGNGGGSGGGSPMGGAGGGGGVSGNENNSSNDGTIGTTPGGGGGGGSDTTGIGVAGAPGLCIVEY